MKKKMKIQKKQVKARKTWGDVNPVTRTIPCLKKYKRSKEKKDFRKEINGCLG